MFPLSDIHGLPADLDPKTRAFFLKRLKDIFAAMDRKYREAADHYGFVCTGCEDNCCRTRFYHHTLLEYFYISEGFRMLESEKQTEIRHRAKAVCEQSEQADEKGQSVRLMCPLNFDALCVLYQHRPMICRMHGIPHELRSPGSGRIHAPGCHVFSQQHAEKNDVIFDRTPFYVEMATLEKALRQAAGTMEKVRFTVAQMIMGLQGPDK